MPSSWNLAIKTHAPGGYLDTGLQPDLCSWLGCRIGKLIQVLVILLSQKGLFFIFFSLWLLSLFGPETGCDGDMRSMNPSHGFVHVRVSFELSSFDDDAYRWRWPRGRSPRGGSSGSSLCCRTSSSSSTPPARGSASGRGRRPRTPAA